METAPTLSFEHVHIHAADVAAMGDFVVSALGGQLIRKRVTNGFENWEYDLGGIELFIASAAESRTRGPIDHLGFRVTEIERVIDHLQSHGCVLDEGPVVWRADLTFAYLTGPEGLRIELLQRS